MSDSIKPRALIAFLCGFFGLFFGLCTIFALVVTVGQGWIEHSQQSWPEATATITDCDVVPYYRYDRNRSGILLIECKIRYLAGDNSVETKLRSASSTSQSQILLMNQWVNDHEPGSSIAIRYNPRFPQKAVLTVTDMPLSGPHTPNNLKLLLFAAISCIFLLAVARFMRAPSPATT
jgi:hypothetical protein